MLVTGPEPPVLPPTYWALIEGAATEHGDLVLIEDEHDRSITFAAYRERCEQVAAGLLAAGVQPGQVVSWILPTTIDAAVVIGALTRVGVVQNPIITSLGEREVRYITEEAGTDVLLCRSSWRGGDAATFIRPIADDVGFRVVVVDEQPTGDPATLPPPPEPAWGERRAWLYHTSGSTSAPKGVWHSDRTVMAGSNAFVHALAPTVDDVNPQAFPIGHIGGPVKIASALRVGYRLLFIETWDPERTPWVMAEHGCTTLGTALPFFRAFLAAQRAHGDEPLWPRLRACISGGAPKPPGLHAEIKEVLGGAGICGSWGMTEFPLATSASPSDPDDMLDLTEGRPGPGVEVKVVARDGRECGPLEEGELCVRGPQRFLGYASPDLDAEAIDDEGFLRTGDLGVVHPGGYVQVTGRVKDVIIRNAENISASEVEECLLQHPAIADVAVIGVPDPRTGERAVAVVRLADGVDSLTLDDLARHCLDHGFAKWKIPEQLEIVDEIPRTAMGKIEKPALVTRVTATPR